MPEPLETQPCITMPWTCIHDSYGLAIKKQNGHKGSLADLDLSEIRQRNGSNLFVVQYILLRGIE